MDLDNKLPLFAHDQDSGPLVKALIQDTPGKSVVGHRGWLTPRELMDSFAQVAGYQTELLHLPPGQFGFDCKPELRAELQDNFAFANEVGHDGGDDFATIHPSEVSSTLLC
jgi:hypothetical protein